MPAAAPLPSDAPPIPACEQAMAAKANSTGETVRWRSSQERQLRGRKFETGDTLNEPETMRDMMRMLLGRGAQRLRRGLTEEAFLGAEHRSVSGMTGHNSAAGLCGAIPRSPLPSHFGQQSELTLPLQLEALHESKDPSRLPGRCARGVNWSCGERGG